MLNQGVKVTDLNPEQWRRLTELAYGNQDPHRLYLIHEGGQPQRLWDSISGDMPLPSAPVIDAQAAADALHRLHPEASEVWVLDPATFAKKMSDIAGAARYATHLDVHALFEFDERLTAPGFAVSPRRDMVWNGFPLRRVSRFVERMLPESCTYVLGVFDGDALWASLLVQFEGKQIVAISTSDALPADDVKDVVGRDQHPFLLSLAASAFGRPAFGWFVERADFEAYMRAADPADKDEIFQKSLMENRATFDFSILVDRGITAFSPINPGEAAVQGADREANPRTRTPVAGDPGPTAF